MNLSPLLNAFPKKTKVTLIHAITLKTIGVYKIKEDALPNAFNKPTIIELGGTKWRVMLANPINAKEYTIANKLTLHVQEVNSINSATIGFDYPSICDDHPELVDHQLFRDFILMITK